MALVFTRPLENPAPSGHAAVSTFPRIVIQRFLNGFPVPLRTLRAVGRDERLRDLHVTRVVTLTALPKLVSPRSECELRHCVISIRRVHKSVSTPFARPGAPESIGGMMVLIDTECGNGSSVARPVTRPCRKAHASSAARKRRSCRRIAARSSTDQLSLAHRPRCHSDRKKRCSAREMNGTVFGGRNVAVSRGPL